MIKLILIYLILIVWISVIPRYSVSDQTVYSYEDENGIINITTVKPKGKKHNILIKGYNKGKKNRKLKNISKPNKKYKIWINEAADYYNIPTSLLHAVIMVESNYNPEAVSHAGAKGLMQLMPKTAKRLYVNKIMDPKENIFGGARYLRILLNRFDGDLVLALAGYHAGENAVEKAGGIPYKATKRYIKMVLTRYDKLRNLNQNL